MNKIVMIAILASMLGASAASAGEILGFINIAYVRGAYKTVADDQDRHERKDGRLGSGIVVLSPEVVPERGGPNRQRHDHN